MSILKLGKLLMERRGEEGIREFAKKLGISPATLSRIENGKLPDLETFSKLCAKLELDPAELLQLGKKSSAKHATPTAGVTAYVHMKTEIGRASCREREKITVEAVSRKKKW